MIGSGNLRIIITQLDMLDIILQIHVPGKDTHTHTHTHTLYNKHTLMSVRTAPPA